MKNRKSIRHHTIPQFYLNGFAVKKRKEYEINVYNKNANTNYSQLVKNIGYIKDFNTIEIEGKKTDIFENLHNEVFEKFFSKKYFEVIRKIERYNQIENYCYNCISIDYYRHADSYCLDHEDKYNISFLLAYFILRSRKLRYYEEKIREKKELILNDIYRAKGYVNKETVKNKIDEQIGTQEDIKKRQLISLFEGNEINEFAEILYNHKWVIAYNNTEKLLYTSDNGHALDSAENQNYTGYNTYGNIIFFPINYRICIIMYDQKRFQRIIADMMFTNLSLSQVKSINNEIVYDGIDEIYSKDGNWDDLRDYYMKKKIPKGHKPYSVS